MDYSIHILGDKVFHVKEPYYLGSCNHCGWIGSTEFCTSDDCDDVYCPVCHRAGADSEKLILDSEDFYLESDEIYIEDDEDDDGNTIVLDIEAGEPGMGIRNGATYRFMGDTGQLSPIQAMGRIFRDNANPCYETPIGGLCNIRETDHSSIIRPSTSTQPATYMWAAPGTGKSHIIENHQRIKQDVDRLSNSSNLSGDHWAILSPGAIEEIFWCSEYDAFITPDIRRYGVPLSYSNLTGSYTCDDGTEVYIYCCSLIKLGQLQMATNKSGFLDEIKNKGANLDAEPPQYYEEPVFAD